MTNGNENQIRKGRRCVGALSVHLVFVTKYRRNVFVGDMLERLEQIFSEVCQGFEVKLKEFDSRGDCIYLLVDYPPKVQISKLINSLKGVSSRLMRKEYPVIHSHLLNGALWSPSYFAGSGGSASLGALASYIEQQNQSA